MKPIPTILAILLIIGMGIGGVFLLKKYMPEAKKENRAKVEPSIEVMVAKAQDVEITVASQGLIEPELETVATSEVAGQVMWVSEKFEAGGVFEENDVLLRLDDTDYRAALEKAKAEEAGALLDLKMELSRKTQAERDWKELGGNREASELAKREPQVAAAEATLAAARVAVEKAEKDVKRTELKALYSGRIKSTATDLGSYVTPGARMAELYATALYKVRLPVSLDSFSFVDINAPGNVVTLRTKVAGEIKEWKASILRSEGQIDRASRSVFVVAGLKAGEGGFTREDVLTPNLFVEAEIRGRTLKNVVKIPRIAFVKPGTVLVVDKDSKLQFREVEVKHEGTQELYVAAGVNDEKGLLDGERVCITPLAAVVKGMKVKVLDEEKAEEPDGTGEPKPGKGEVIGAG